MNTDEPFHSCCRSYHLLTFTPLFWEACCLITLSKSLIKAFTEHKDWSLNVHLLSLPNSIKKQNKTEGTFARVDKPPWQILAHFLLPKLYYNRMIQTLVSKRKFVKKSHTIVSTHKLISAFAIFHCVHAIGTHKASLWQHPSACAKLWAAVGCREHSVLQVVLCLP